MLYINPALILFHFISPLCTSIKKNKCGFQGHILWAETTITWQLDFTTKTPEKPRSVFYLFVWLWWAGWSRRPQRECEALGRIRDTPRPPSRAGASAAQLSAPWWECSGSWTAGRHMLNWATAHTNSESFTFFPIAIYNLYGPCVLPCRWVSGGRSCSAAAPVCQQVQCPSSDPSTGTVHPSEAAHGNSQRLVEDDRH